MAFVKITELPVVNDAFTVSVPTLTAGDVMPIVHGPTTYKVELSTLQEYFNLNVAFSAAGDTGEVQVNDFDRLSAFKGFVYLKDLSAVQIGENNIQSGVYGGILGGANNTNTHTNTFILGSNIQAHEDNFTLVNNISSLRDIFAGGRIYTIETGDSNNWYGAFTYAYTNSARLEQPALDSRYVKLSGDTMTGSLSVGGSLSALSYIYGEKLLANVDGVPGFNPANAEVGTIVGNLSVTGNIYGTVSGVALADVANVLYVSTAGNDNNSGRNIFSPLRTIKKACQIVSQNQSLVFPTTDTIGVPTKQWTIFLDTGDYTEQNPIFVPQSTSIIGDNLRRVTVRPANRTYDILWLNNACYVWGLTFRDHLEPAAGAAFPNLDSTTPQFQIAFNTPGYEIYTVTGNDYYRTCKPFITTSPYTQGMSSITQAVVAPQQTDAAAQALSALTYTGAFGSFFNTASARVATEFATWAAIAVGGGSVSPATFPLNLGSRPADYLNAVSVLTTNRSTIQAAITAYIDANFPALFTNPAYQYEACYRDAGYMIDSIIADLKTGSNARIVEAGNVYYIGTLNQFGTPPSIPLSTEETGILPTIWAYAKSYTSALLASYPTSQTYVEGEYDDLINILTNGSGTVAINSLNTPSTDEKRAADLLASNKSFFQAELTAYIDNTYTNWNYGETDPAQITIQKNKSYRDTGWLIDSIVYDLNNGTNARAVTYANSFWMGTSNSRLNGKQYVCASSFNYAKYLASFVIQNTLAGTTNAGCGIRVDGSLARGYLRSFVTDSYTQFNEGGAGLHITNNGYAQLVSTFTICCTVGVSADNGGTCSINTSNCSFGLSGLVGNGYSPTPVLTGQLAQNVLYNSDVMVISGITPRDDAPDYTQWPVPVSNPYVGLVFKIDNDPTDTLYILTSAYNTDAGTYAYAINTNLPTTTTIAKGGNVTFYIRSQVWTGSHTFEYIGSGTILKFAVPALGGVANPDDEARGINGGAVFFTSTNHLGNFKVGNDFTIVQELGVIEGRTFQRSILALVTPLTLALE